MVKPILPVTCYSYDPVTKVYTGTELAYPDPLDGDLVLPANSTFKPLPENWRTQTLYHHSWVFDGKEWIQVVDERGTRYWLKDGSEHVITDLGVVIPEDALFQKPLITLEEKQAYVFSELNSSLLRIMVANGWTDLADVICRNMSNYPEWKELTDAFIRHRNNVLHTYEIRKGELKYTDPQEFLSTFPKWDFLANGAI